MHFSHIFLYPVIDSILIAPQKYISLHLFYIIVITKVKNVHRIESFFNYYYVKIDIKALEDFNQILVSENSIRASRTRNKKFSARNYVFSSRF